MTVEEELGALRRHVTTLEEALPVGLAKRLQALEGGMSDLSDKQLRVGQNLEGATRLLRELRCQVEGEADTWRRQLAAVSQQVRRTEQLAADAEDRAQADTEALRRREADADARLRRLEDRQAELFGGERLQRLLDSSAAEWAGVERLCTDLDQRLALVEEALAGEGLVCFAAAAGQASPEGMEDLAAKAAAHAAQLGEADRRLSRFEGLLASVERCASGVQAQVASLESKVRAEERCRSEDAATHREQLLALERRISEDREELAKDFRALQLRLQEVQERVVEEATASQQAHAKLKQRLTCVEVAAGESCERLEQLLVARSHSAALAAAPPEGNEAASLRAADVLRLREEVQELRAGVCKGEADCAAVHAALQDRIAQVERCSPSSSRRPASVEAGSDLQRLVDCLRATADAREQGERRIWELEQRLLQTELHLATSISTGCSLEAGSSLGDWRLLLQELYTDPGLRALAAP